MKILSTNALTKFIQLIKNNVYNPTNTELVEIDNAPIEDSENLITSGAVFSTVGNIETILDSLIGGNGS